MIANISISAQGQKLLCESIKVASDTIAEIGCTFTLSSDWSAFNSVSAIFTDSIGNSYTATLVNNYCVIPHEVLDKKGKVTVNLCGYTVSGTTKTLQLTSYKTVCVNVLQKVTTSGTNSTTPTADQWQQELSAEATLRSTGDATTLSSAKAYSDATKQATLVSGTNIKTINNASILGSGNLDAGGLPVLTGTSNPTSATVGSVGQLYLNTDAQNGNGEWFRCSSASNGSYTWSKEAVISGSNFIWGGYAGISSQINIAIGGGAIGSREAIAIGTYSCYANGASSIALGASATAAAEGAVQIKQGINDEANSLQFRSYKLVKSDGTIPPARTVQQGTTVPSGTADVGQMYLDTTTETAYMYTGTQWKQITA